ncbi:MAG: hypothetical protein K6G76_12475 [Lachnospiraceae bacterium]|nr:hypothetical protein [Lachnospiraceae bacterium]
MNKKVFYPISIVVNILLVIAIVVLLKNAGHKMKFEYVDTERISQESMRTSFEKGCYGQAVLASYPVRGGAEIAKEYEEYYRLGEYTELKFFKEVYAKEGNADMLTSCDKRLSELREEMPDYATLFDKIDQSTDKAIRE